MKRFITISISVILILALTGCGSSDSKANGASSANTSTDLPLSIDVLANSGNPTLELISKSYSASSFAEGEVSDQDIEKIVASGAKAPSAKNYQPWHFSVIQNEDMVSELLGSAKLGNLGQAKSGNIIIVISGNKKQYPETMKFDCGLAAMNMQLAAESLGYGVRIYIEPVSKIEKEYRNKIGVPDNYDVLTAMLIGKQETPDASSSATPRRQLNESVSWIK